MTKRDIFVEKDVVMNTMMWIATWNGIIPAPAVLKVTAVSVCLIEMQVVLDGLAVW